MASLVASRVEEVGPFSDFESVFWHGRSVGLPLDLERCTLYVGRRQYDSDLKKGMPTSLVAQRQFQLDRHRSDFQSDGPVPLSLVPYCTQAVMALPIEAIARGGSSPRLVAERIPPLPMVVRVKDGNVTISKPLRLIEGYKSRRIDIRILVDDNVVVCDVFSSPYPSKS